MGYVPSERAVRIAQLIRQGHEIRAIFQAATPYGATIRVAFGGDDPVLPPVRPAEPDQDWWPDPTYED